MDEGLELEGLPAELPFGGPDAGRLHLETGDIIRRPDLDGAGSGSPARIVGVRLRTCEPGRDGGGRGGSHENLR
jgi:hypothetical protein